MSLEDLAKPENVAAIKEEYEARKQREAQRFAKNQRLCDMWDDEEEGQNSACLLCHI